jgi:hypothetical protein
MSETRLIEVIGTRATALAQLGAYQKADMVVEVLCSRAA